MRVTHPPTKPLMVFDGECRFCRHWIARWQRHAAGRLDFQPYQHEAVARQYPEIPRDLFAQTVVLIAPSGDVFTGAEAVFRARDQRAILWAYQHLPGGSAVAEASYRFVAAHRGALSWLTRLFRGGGVG